MDPLQGAANDEDNQSTAATGEVDQLDLDDNQVGFEDPSTTFGQMEDQGTQIDVDLENRPSNVGPSATDVSVGYLERRDDEGEGDENADRADAIEPDDLVENENGELGWIDTFEIADFRYRHQDVKILGQPHRWKGAEWTLYLVYEYNSQRHNDRAGIFIGFQNPSLLPKGFSIKAKYWIRELPDAQNIDLNWTDAKSAEITYTKPKVFNSRTNNGTDRFDTGFWDTINFPVETILTQNARNEIYVIHIEIKMKLIFTPAIVPFNYNSKTVTGMVGLENLGATCYLNALLQMLFHLNIFRRMVYQMPHQGEDLSSSITLALQYVFKNLQSSSTEVSTKDLTRAFGWTTQEAFMQQDIQEMLRVLVDKLEEKMKDTALDGRVKSLFAGSIRSYIKCVHVEFQSTREEDFYDVQLDIRGCSSIYASLDKYVEIETLEGENQYDAEKFGKQDAKKGVTFTKFPPVLTMHLKRFDFDLTLMNFRKIHDYYEFPCLLNLDKYLAEDCPPEARNVPNRYILHSVLVHSGDVGGGHYYAYIRPATDKNVQNVYTLDHFDSANSSDDAIKFNVNGSMEDWFKFNDDVVLPVTKREAVNFCYGRKKDDDFYRSYASAYMLVYIREHEATAIMQPLQETDIPLELQVRFDAELAFKRAQQRNEARLKMLMKVHFVLEQDLATFNNYSRNQDLFDDTKIRHTFLLRDSTHTGFQLYLAQMLNVHPLSIKLWIIESSGNHPRKSTLRVTRHVSIDDLGKTLLSNSKRPYFVQVLTPDYLLDSQLMSQFDTDLQLIYQRMNNWREHVRQQLNRFPDLAFNEGGHDDPLVTALPGMNNALLLKELTEYDNDLDPQFENEAKAIIHGAVDLLKEFTMSMDAQKVADEMEDELSREEEEDVPLEALIFFKVFDPLNLLPPLTQQYQHKQQQQEDGGEEMMTTITATPSYIPEMSGEPFGLENVTFYGEQYHADSAFKYLGCVQNPSTNIDMYDLFDFLVESIMTLLQRRFPVAQIEAPSNPDAYYLAADPMTMIPVTDRHHFAPNMTLTDLLEEYDSPLFIVHLTLPDRLPEPHPLDSQCLLGIQQYTKFLHTKRKVTILPSCADDLKILYNIVSRYEASAAGNASAALTTATASTSNVTNAAEESQTLGEDIAGSESMDAGLPAPVIAPAPFSLFKSPVRRKQKRKRTLESASRDGSLLRILYGIDIDITANTKLYDVISFIGHRIGAESDQIALCPASPYLGDVYEQTKYNSFLSSISSCTFNEFLKRSDNRLTNQKSRIFVFYKLLPVPLQTDNGEDVRIGSRILDFTINDERLRRWRMAFLYQAHSRRQANQNGGLLEEKGAVKARKLSSIDKLSIGSKLASAVATAGGMSLEQQEFFQWVMNLSKTTDLAWPAAGEPNPYNMPQIGRLVLSVNKTEWKFRTAEVLRDALGLPANLLEVPSLQEQQVVPPDHRQNRHHRGREIFVDRVEIDEETGMMRPVMPLIIGVISHHHLIKQLFDFYIDPSVIPASWPELRESLSQSDRLFVQTCEPQDVIFLRKEHPQIRSMLITIFNFTLIGNAVKPVDIDIYNGPIVTFIKEDDDYEALIQRIGVITGESNLMKLKLAVIDPQNMTPDFIPKPSFISSSESAAAQEQDAIAMDTTMPAIEAEQAVTSTRQDTDETIILPRPISATMDENESAYPSKITVEDRELLLTKKRPPVTIYERFLIKYPSFEDVHNQRSAYDWNVKANKGINKVCFPSLGIQRAAAEVQTLLERREMSLNAQPGEMRSRQYNSGIKIV